MQYQIPKKIAMINDIAGYGRCSTTVAVPVISAMKVQVCPVPTSVFSNHTGFSEHFMKDLTDELPSYLHMWEQLGFTFDGIYSGFLGSVRQVQMVIDFIQYSKKQNTPPLAVIDPVIGDHGKPYRTITKEHCEAMKHLIRMADIITPNITEACILTDTPYRETGWTDDALRLLAGKLHALGPSRIVITGMREENNFLNYISEKTPLFAEAQCAKSLCPKIQLIETHIKEEKFLQPSAGSPHHGTGDIFSAIIAADAAKGNDFASSVRRASRFVSECIRVSELLHIPEKDGVCVENLLHLLMD